jgi:hypothetical protein
MPMVYISEHANVELEKYRARISKVAGIDCDRSQAILKSIHGEHNPLGLPEVDRLARHYGLNREDVFAIIKEIV